jgi:hypothetical protein
MRILIFSETQEAKAQLAQERECGNRASLRNPYYFDPAQLEKACDLVITDDPAILAAYREAGIHTQPLTPEPMIDIGEPGQMPAAEGQTPADETEKPEAPKSKSSRKKSEA